jgi:hypothetical protein
MTKPKQYRVQQSLHQGIVSRAFGGKVVSWSPWRTLKSYQTLQAAQDAASVIRGRVGLGRTRVMYGNADVTELTPTTVPQAPAQYLITAAQVKTLEEVLEDLTGLIDCNCGGAKCEGECTYSAAQQMLIELAQLKEAQEPASPRDTCSLCGEPHASHQPAAGNSAPFCMGRLSRPGDRFVRGAGPTKLPV